MTTAARTRRRVKHAPVHIQETVKGSSARVDRDAGIIGEVRVLGPTSQNGRRYTPEALRQALSLYEGVAVRINHPKRASDQRDSEDVFGWLRSPRFGGDGAIYADLHFLKSHPLAERICEAAERNPSLFGLSHNADGTGHTDSDGTFVVESLTEVRSVDLVADPATNRSLFESNQSMSTTLRKLIESSQAKSKKALKRSLIEMGDDYSDMADMPMDMPAEPVDSGDWKADLVAAIGKLVASESPEDHDMARKIMNMLKPASAAAPMEEQDDDMKKGEKEKEVEEGGSNKIRGKNQADQISAMWAKDPDNPYDESRHIKPSTDPAVVQLQEELAVRDLIEEAGIKFAKVESRKTFIRSLIPLSKEERKTLIEERKALSNATSARLPRSSSPVVSASNESKGAKDVSEFVSLVTL